jgi:hypothetical protein
MAHTVQELLDLGYEVIDDPAPPDGFTVLSGFDHAVVVEDSEGISDAAFNKAVNQAQIYRKLEQARDYFGDNYKNWGSLSAAQKDTANRQAQRALANFARFTLRDMSTGGE